MHVNFQMMQNHKYRLHELENQIPWEREVYVELLLKHLKDKEAEMKKHEAEMKAARNRR